MIAIAPHNPTTQHSGPKETRSFDAALLPEINPAKIERTKVIKDTDSLNPLDFLQNIINWTKKLGKNACLLGGFISGTGVVASFLALNSKLISALFAIPAILFFSQATSLARSLEKSQTLKGKDMIKTPLEKLETILQDTSKLLSDEKLVISAIESVAKLKEKDSSFDKVMEKFALLKSVIERERDSVELQEDENKKGQYQKIIADYVKEMKKTLVIIEQNYPGTVGRFMTQLMSQPETTGSKS